MSLRLTVELVCDARRAPGCHSAYAAWGDALATVVVEVEKEAQATVQRTQGHIIYPACEGRTTCEQTLPEIERTVAALRRGLENEGEGD
jgi:hypothetical protein